LIRDLYLLRAMACNLTGEVVCTICSEDAFVGNTVQTCGSCVSTAFMHRACAARYLGSGGRKCPTCRGPMLDLDVAPLPGAVDHGDGTVEWHRRSWVMARHEVGSKLADLEKALNRCQAAEPLECRRQRKIRVMLTSEHARDRLVECLGGCDRTVGSAIIGGVAIPQGAQLVKPDPSRQDPISALLEMEFPGSHSVVLQASATAWACARKAACRERQGERSPSSPEPAMKEAADLAALLRLPVRCR